MSVVLHIIKDQSRAALWLTSGYPAVVRRPKPDPDKQLPLGRAASATRSPFLSWRAKRNAVSTKLSRAGPPRDYAAEHPVPHNQRVKQNGSKMGDECEE